MNGLVDILQKLGPGRLAAMGAVTLALVGFFAFVILRVTQPTLGVLYSDLPSQDASSIVRDLETRGIRYEVRADGQTILVPRSDIAKLRMEFAGKGLPSGGGVGYEIFDKGDAFSATTFVQGINHVRALEGELSRTIRSIAKVQAARVHLVIPERRLFERDREPPRASIALKLAGELERDQVRAIRHLVATAVEGLKPERVSIIDEKGRLLADGAQSAAGLLGVAAEERQATLEQRLRAQVEEILAGIVGQGRARVQVAAEIDNNRIESRSETFDPESRVVRSTQTRNENQTTSEQTGAVSAGNELPGTGQNQQGASPRDASTKAEEVVNYEISRTTRTEVVEGGRIKRLSIAVVVDGAYTRGANGQSTYQPRPQEELDRIAAIVRTAIGFNSQRGDQVEVVNLRFADPPAIAQDFKEQTLVESFFSFTKEDILKLIELGVLFLLVLIVLLTVVRPLLKQITSPASSKRRKVEQSAGYENAQIEMPRPSQAAQMLEVAKVVGQLQEKSVEGVGEVVKNSPQESVAVLRQWLHQGA